MRYKYYSILLVLFVFVTVSVHAQLFRPFTSFRLIRTEHFDIIFPRESEVSARILASYADDVYRELSSLLGIGLPGRLPVTLAPHTDLFNGFYSPIPSPRIVLFDTPMNPEWTSFPDGLKGLFIHELAHAISMNTRGGGWDVTHRIFGNWATPALWNAPLFMVEGVAIYMESLSGFGRANDPLARQMLRQAIHEGKFLTPLQASGVHDFPTQRGAFYEYGGLFSQWLVQTYGAEKHARLWQAMGRNPRFSFFVYRSGFYGIFRNVYNMDFMDAWNAFRDSLALSGLEENPYEVLPRRYRFFTERRASISAMAANGNNIYILDGPEGRIRVYDTTTGSIRSFTTSSLLSYDIDVSADGTTLLVSGYRLTGERYRAVVTKHRADTGRRIGRSIQGLYRARFFRDGVIGIRSDLHNTLIVSEDFNGNSRVLFRGNRGLLFSGPQAVDDEHIAFVALRDGVRNLLIYNYVSGELFRVEAYSGDSNYWRYMRGLGVSEGKLFFSHNTDDRMYKLASINLQTMQAVFSGRDFSGGVFLPVAVNGVVYYRGAFFYGDSLLRFPEMADSLSGTQVNIRLVKLNKENYGRNVPVQPDGPYWTGACRPYFSFMHMNPFRFWLPLPLLRTTHNNDNSSRISLDGIGILSIITDPTGRHFIAAHAYADAAYRMVMVENFSWQNTVPGFPLTLEFSDMVLRDTNNLPYRDTRLALSGTFIRSPGRWLYGLSLGGGYLRTARDNGGESAYHWEETDSAFFYFSGLVLSNLRRRQHELFGTGMSLNLRWVSFIGTPFREHFEPRFEAMFRASVETRFPLSLTLYGVYDARQMNLHGVSRSYGQPLFAAVASTEYPHPRGLNLTWLGGAELSLGLFSFEIQRNLSHAYFNRAFGTLALRSVLYESQDHPAAEGIALGDELRLAQSLVLRLGLVSSFIPIKITPVFVEPYIWGAWRFSNTITGEGELWNFGMGVNLRF